MERVRKDSILMRVAAVALVLIVGAAVVLAFANTLNSWVLGGLLGGLAAILLSIPISLALFTLLARRHDARRQADEPLFEEEPGFADEFYDEPVVYEAEGYALPLEDEALADPRLNGRGGRPPVSGYLPLPPVDQGVDDCDEEVETLTRREPRNYPRQPRYPARSLVPGDESKSLPRSHRDASTRSLAQHQALARRQAREEALRRADPGSFAQRQRGAHTPPTLRSRSSGRMRSPGSSFGSRRPADEYDSRRTRQPSTRSAWYEHEEMTEDFSTEQLRARYEQAQRRRVYRPDPRASRSRAVDPWTSESDDEQEEPPALRPRPESERRSGSLQNPLVRRAPYLYEDDPLREEFAQQLKNDPPITRRSSRYEAYDDEEEY
jgi:hypothetical protein